MSLFAAFGFIDDYEGEERVKYSGPGVRPSSDLTRILALPRRTEYTINKALIDSLRKENPNCKCEALGRNCCKDLRPVQEAALSEMHELGGLLGPIGVGHGKCEAAGTEIFDVLSGRRRMVEEPGLLHTTSMNEKTHRLVVNSALSFSSGVKPCVRVTLSDGSSVEVSTDHPIYTQRGWVNAESLKKTDLVATPSRMPAPVQPLDIQDAEVIAVAYLMSDGGVSQAQAMFTQMDGRVLEEAYEVFSSVAGGLREVPSKSKARQFRVLKTRAFREKWGVNGLAKEKRLDARFWGLSNRQTALFLNRFWACDGHISKQGVEITLASEKLLADLRFMLLRLGVVTRTRYTPKKLNGKTFPAWCLYAYGAEALRFLEEVGFVLGKESACCKLFTHLASKPRNTNTDIVPVSRPEFLEICAELGFPPRGKAIKGGKRSAARDMLGCTQGQYVSRGKFESFCQEFGYRGKYARFASRDIRWSYVQSVTATQIQKVYDVSVATDHNFVANGIIIHNSLLDLLAPMAVKNCKRAVLLVPASLRSQLVDVDIEYYGQHWNLPNIAGEARWMMPGKPVLNVISYSELSGAKSTDLFEKRMLPDLVILDEAHSVKNRSAARTKRLFRYLSTHPEVRVCCWSGTLMTKSIHDYAQLAKAALGENAPVPLFHPVVEEWAAALDPVNPSAPGALEVLGPDIRKGFSDRLLQTKGVVSSGDAASCQATIIINDISPKCTPAIDRALRDLRESWCRPDGEELVETLDVVRLAREISMGFFYRWKWIHGETKEQIEKWLEVRACWHKELREKLKHATTHADSPLLLAHAAHRWHFGYSYEDEHGKRKFIGAHTKNGPRKSWASEFFLPWREIKDTCKPSTEAVWLDDSIAMAAAKWAGENVGIVWADHTAFGLRVARLADKTFYGAGDEAARGILAEDGSRSIVASFRAHHIGRNLQNFSHSLVPCPSGNGAAWEQLIGRSHRQGQTADEVVFDVFCHTEVLQEAMVKSFLLSENIDATLQQSQKLCSLAQHSIPIKKWRNKWI